MKNNKKKSHTGRGIILSFTGIMFVIFAIASIVKETEEYIYICLTNIIIFIVAGALMKDSSNKQAAVKTNRKEDRSIQDMEKERKKDIENLEKYYNNPEYEKIGFIRGKDCSNAYPMDLISKIEDNLDLLYNACGTSTNLQKTTEAFFYNLSTCTMPLMVNVRIDQLKEECKNHISAFSDIEAVDKLEGHNFEYFCANVLENNGFEFVKVTKGSGDNGVDIVAVKDEIRYAIQCKCYSTDIGNKPVQEVYAGKEVYGCQVGVVMTNRYFTQGAKNLAQSTKVLLWDRDRLKKMMNSNAVVSGKREITIEEILKMKTLFVDEPKKEEKHKDVIDDDLLNAVDIIFETGQASVSMIQIRMKLGYSRAALLVDKMEELGIVGKFEGSKPRQIIITKKEWEEMKRNLRHGYN